MNAKDSVDEGVEINRTITLRSFCIQPILPCMGKLPSTKQFRHCGHTRHFIGLHCPKR